MLKKQVIRSGEYDGHMTKKTTTNSTSLVTLKNLR